MTAPDRTDPASFRDPAGFVYERDGVIYRQVNAAGLADYDALMSSGLHHYLMAKRWIVAHEEMESVPGALRTLRPEQIPYISYPYEWSFSQLQDAALLTLDIQIASLERGFTLKDASAYNVQFIGSQPIFIDTLSFEQYRENEPWVAYRQFCQHFLAPLAIMACTDVRLRRLIGGFIDGVPLDLASRLLPRSTWLRPGLATHIHLHARSQHRYRGEGRSGAAVPRPKVSKRLIMAMIDGLRRTVAGCRMREQATEWGDYYADTNYSSEAMAAKQQLVSELVASVAPPGGIVHDLGANTGRFSRVVSESGRYVVAHDIDELAVERHYRANRTASNARVLPLLLDLTNPSPSLGWASSERPSAIDRMAGHTAVALALVHHLAISNNVPLPTLATFFGRLAEHLVVEFVPKEDSQVSRLLATRPDIFPDYHEAGFEAAFSSVFRIDRRCAVPGTSRVLFAMTRSGRA
jgi:ribosomal protein L11 methylase PrmA